jgi:hypothetical protein
MINHFAELRRRPAEEGFIDMPVAYDPLGGRLIESTGSRSSTTLTQSATTWLR